MKTMLHLYCEKNEMFFFFIYSPQPQIVFAIRPALIRINMLERPEKIRLEYIFLWFHCTPSWYEKCVLPFLCVFFCSYFASSIEAFFWQDISLMRLILLYGALCFALNFIQLKGLYVMHFSMLMKSRCINQLFWLWLQSFSSFHYFFFFFFFVLSLLSCWMCVFFFGPLSSSFVCIINI